MNYNKLDKIGGYDLHIQLLISTSPQGPRDNNQM